MLKTILGVSAGVLLALGLARPLRAQQDDANCRDPRTQLEMNICAGRGYEAADARLNQTYTRLVALLDGPAKEQLRAAQRAWIRFRDAHCAFEAAGYEGGSMQPLIRFGCLGAVTNARTEQLQELLKDTERYGAP